MESRGLGTDAELIGRSGGVLYLQNLKKHLENY